MISISHCSDSTSAISTESRATLVEIETDLPETKEPSFEVTYKALPYLPPRSNLINHLLEMFCVKWLNKSKGGSQIDNYSSAWPSPWILPIHVVSNRQDKERHPITKIAKCTIDTGNMQGNIVSRDFVENVLEFPSASFVKLTSEEEKGGTSITGDLHTPQGAIYLTWYHNNSTRVFRNMRFLISPAPNCDIIIGAQSIQKDKILSVPCLMGDKRDIPAVRESVKQDPEEQNLNLIESLVNSTLNDKHIETEDDDPADIVEKLQKEHEVVNWTIELHKIAHPRQGYSSTGELSQEELWSKIESDFPKVSNELGDQLNRILEGLRRDLGHKDSKNPWKKAPRGWWSRIDYSEVNKPL